MSETSHSKFHNRDISQWLIERKTGITGTDIGKIMGLSHWGNSMKVWEDKMGMTPPIPDNENMLWGRVLEPIILEEYSRRNSLNVIKPEGIVRGSEEWMIGSPDGVVISDSGEWEYGVEIKTGQIRNPAGEKRWSKPGVTPIVISPDYEYQCRWYMAITNLPYWKLVALLNGSDYREYHIERDMQLEEHMITICRDFWFNNVLAKIPPQ